MDHRPLSWLYPKPTGNPGHDRNARTVQFTSILLTSAISVVAITNGIAKGQRETLLLLFGVAGLVAAIFMNRMGSWKWAARTALLVLLLTAVMLVFEARDGFRSHAMLIFPGVLLLSVMLLDRGSYVINAVLVLAAVAALGIGEKRGVTHARVPTSASYSSIFFVDLHLLVLAVIGGRIARDVQSNVFDLRASIDRYAKTAEALRGSETRLKDAQRLARIGSWEREIESGNAIWSDEMFRIYGLPKGAPPSPPAFFNSIYPEDRTKLVAAHEQVCTSGAPVQIEFRIVRPDGELRFVKAIIEGIRDESGAVFRMVGASHDITDQKRAQDEVFARQKLESVGTLASGIAHDFNNLLGAVLAQAELAMAELAAGSPPHEELEQIRNVAMRGSEVVRQLMIYAGTEAEVLHPVDVSQAVAQMVALMRVSVSKHATLATDLAKNLPAVQTSAAQLQRIVMNLVTNASEAVGDRDGLIQVTTRCVTVGPERSQVTWGGLGEGDYLQLEVSDSGVGIPWEAQARLFDPFFTTKSAGHGLGLAVVHGIVRSLAGSISVESDVGKGATFRILLPCAKSLAGPIDSASSGTDEAAPSFRATILVVEDEDALRYGVVKMLRRAGHFVVEAIDGSAALEAIRARDAIDVLVLDISIPGASSKEVFEEAKRLRPGMGLIVTSAYGEDVAAEKLGRIDHFIRKPYPINDLLDLIRQVSS